MGAVFSGDTLKRKYKKLRKETLVSFHYFCLMKSITYAPQIVELCHLLHHWEKCLSILSMYTAIKIIVK